MNQSTNIVSAFLDGLTAAGLFRRLSYPGAPRHFVDQRSLPQYLADENDRGDYVRHCKATPGTDGAFVGAETETGTRKPSFGATAAKHQPTR